MDLTLSIPYNSNISHIDCWKLEDQSEALRSENYPLGVRKCIGFLSIITGIIIIYIYRENLQICIHSSDVQVLCNVTFLQRTLLTQKFDPSVIDQKAEEPKLIAIEQKEE